jgi:hypothetical protein
MTHARRTAARPLAAVLVGALIALPAGAFGVTRGVPVKAATYHGGLTGSQANVTLAFSVSTNGTRVTDVRINLLPFYCAGVGPGPTAAPRITFAAVSISPRGAFATAGSDRVASGPLKGALLAKLELTGRFAARAATGTLATTYTGAARRCSGRSAYRTVS